MPPSIHVARRTRAPAGFLFGVACYSEHDLPSHLEEDVDRLCAAGVNVVRMAEFAWDLMEPREGEFDFSFFEHHVDRLGKAGIKTVLCTPTATPPAWLTWKYLDVLQVDASGRSMKHGARQHASLCSREGREFSRRITRAMAEHFAAKPARDRMADGTMKSTAISARTTVRPRTKHFVRSCRTDTHISPSGFAR